VKALLNSIRYGLHLKVKVQSWLRHTQSVKTPCNECGDADLSEQPWPQLMCCASYKLHGCNFRG